MTPVCRFAGLSMAFKERTVFDGLTATLPTGVCGLIGPNDRGKSVLLKTLSADLTSTAGQVHWERRYYRVDQVARSAGPRVADALGVAELFDCFARIEQGEAVPADLDRVADQWHLPAQWQQALDEAGLRAALDTPVVELSGGQQTRLALCAAFLHSESYLLLDEPSNHLDGAGRRWLMDKLFQHPGGALVATHDRALLRRVNGLFELTGRGLRFYGDGYDLYRSVRDAEAASLDQKADAARRQLRKACDEEQAAQQRAARRRKQGERLRRSGSQAKVLLDGKAQNAQRTEGRLKAMREQCDRQLREQLQQTKTQRDRLRPQHLAVDHSEPSGGPRLHLENLQLPWVMQSPLNLSVRGGERWRLQGRNGTGKSTLLKIIAGQLAPRAGRCRVNGTCYYLDQDCGLLENERSAVDNFHRLHPDIAPTEWRTRLGALRLRGDKALAPVAELSGGERLKVALLTVTGGSHAPGLLLLDEPDNHLDLDSRELLEATLRDYPGAMLVVSHDEDFVAGIGIERTLTLNSPQGR